MSYKPSELETELEDELKVCCGATTEALDLIRQTLSIMKRRSDAISAKNDAECYQPLLYCVEVVCSHTRCVTNNDI